MKNLKRVPLIIMACSLLLMMSLTAVAQAQTGTTVPGLIHLWSGEGNANDSVGSANGTLGTTTAFGAGLNGQAFSFDGLETSIINPLPVDINPSALPQMTMGMLVNLRSVANNRGWVIGHDNSSFDRSLNLTDDRYGSGVAGGTGTLPHASSLIKPKDSLNTWHCVAASYDSAAQTATDYADGSTQTVSANPGPGEANATLGGLNLVPGHTVDGLVDEVFKFNRVLSVGEIDQVCADLSNQPLGAGFDQALEFDGVNDYVAVNQNPSINFAGSDDFTFSTWVKPTATGGVIAHWYATGWGPLQIYLSNTADGKLWFALGKRDVAWDPWHSSTGTIPFDEWSQVAFVKQGGTAKIYINGVFDSNHPISSTVLSSTASTATKLIGVDPWAWSGYFHGRMDEFRVWNTALDPATIQHWMYREIDASHPDYANLKAYYKFNDGAGSTATDETGVNPGTLTNFTDPFWVESDIPSVVTDEDTSVNGRLVGSDVDGDSLISSVVSQGLKGTVTITNPAYGAFTYAPAANENGDDSFTYRVHDGLAYSNVETVDVYINPANDTPVVNAGPDATINEGETFVSSPSAGLVSWWQGEGDATDSLDGNNGALQGGATFAPGQVGQAFSFSGGSYVEAPDAPSLRPQQLTLAAWAFPTELNRYRGLVTKEPPNGSSGQIGYGLRQRANNHFGFPISYEGWSFAWAESSTAFTLWQWYHLVGTYDGTTAKLYINGVLAGTGAGAVPITSTFPLRIGKLNSGGEPFTGQIDEVALYNRALSDAEVGVLFNLGMPSSFFTDPGADTWRGTVNYGDGSGNQSLALNPDKTFSLSHVYADNGTYTVTVPVTDDDSGVGADTLTVTVNNVAPTVTATGDTVDENGVATASADFTDAGTQDTHTAEWDWGDNSTSPGTGTEVGGSGTVTGSHTYTTPGVYTLTLTVTDDDTGQGQSVFQFVVVYDPEGGFVTGGGRIDSPQGSYAADPTLAGRASFGFGSKYKKGATIPTGQTQFQYKVGDLNFHSTAYQWLVIAGARAQHKGTGTINGQGNYGFMLTAIDGAVSGGGGEDKCRIKIWDKDAGDGIVYDNLMGGADDEDPETLLLRGGSIVIHNK